ncbi:MAG: glutaredoxin family protein [Alphaproteobacteria bacterium]|jgi:glutaredoxin|nr:glutaredoxin family protein [Alphaproteobacteria bacterium]MDP6567798.1 glutaredoxin family protein [Alphaproteobacteria bacterium]MDP6813859.1 glutaredoxin family protein [Alphaproteobacteria bacterium]
MSRQVIVYSTPFCPPCEGLKRYLTAHDVAFTVTDLMMDEAAAERLAEHNIRTAPALSVDGQLYAGTDLQPARLDELLGLE